MKISHIALAAGVALTLSACGVLSGRTADLSPKFQRLFVAAAQGARDDAKRDRSCIRILPFLPLLCNPFQRR